MDPAICESNISSVNICLNCEEPTPQMSDTLLWSIPICDEVTIVGYLYPLILISPLSPSIFPVRSSLNPRNLCWSANVHIAGDPKVTSLFLGALKTPPLFLVLVQSYACLFPFNADGFGDSMDLPDMAWCTHMYSSTYRQKTYKPHMRSQYEEILECI